MALLGSGQFFCSCKMLCSKIFYKIDYNNSNYIKVDIWISSVVAKN